MAHSVPIISNFACGVERIVQSLLTHLIRRLQLTATDMMGDDIREHQSYSINYRISIGSQKGKKVFALQTLPPMAEERQGTELVGKLAGFSLHAGVSAKAYERDKLERLCRYISRPPVAANRLSLTTEGNVRYTLKTPYRNGTTDVVFEPLDFISKLAAIIPSPRVNLTRFHGVFAPNSQYRASIINQPNKNVTKEKEIKTDSEKRRAMKWAERLKRAFNIDIKTCEACGGQVKIIVCIDEPVVINKILSQLKLEQNNQTMLPGNRAPPATLLLN